jgi:hypothetical protein
MRLGDAIVLLYGLSTPVILQTREGGSYQWVRDAYIHGLMDGKSMQDFEKKFYRREVFTLI